MSGAIQIRDWKPQEKNTLRGFFSVVLPSGLILHRCSLQQAVASGKRWIGLPAREWLGPDGRPAFAKLIEFVDPATSDRFQAAVLAALDRHLDTLTPLELAPFASRRKPMQQALPVEDEAWKAL